MTRVEHERTRAPQNPRLLLERVAPELAGGVA